MSRKLVACGRCEELVFEGSCACPHCGLRYPCRGHGLSRSALALGVAAALACGDKDSDTGDSEILAQPEYGVAETGWIDEDGDGWTIREGDCDDADAAVHPEAEETPGDGVDSNCDEDDDT